MSPASDLTPTAKVILGMVALGRQTGYDIKQFVDKTTRHFLAASYGQIYPELKRLEQQGLLTSAAQPSGGRARTVYELTDAGRAALNQWLGDGAEPIYELRDEGMLKLFFSDTLPEQRIAIVRAMRASNERTLAALRELEPHASQGPAGPRLTLELGIGLHQWQVDWCKAVERRLAEEAEER